MKSALATLVFIPLQLIWLPVTIIGALLVAYKQMVVSRRLGVSQTGIEILNGRWTMHVFGMRDDEATLRLGRALPNTSFSGLWLALFPLWLRYRLSGTYLGYPRVATERREGIADLVPARTLYIDRIIERVLGGVEQFVVMGAGYDTRAYGGLKDHAARFFELDQVATQACKVRGLQEAGIEHDHVSFVSVDFEKDDIFAKLSAAGFESTKSTLFLWEGVTLYLAEKAVRKTLRDIKEHSGPGSVVVADLYGGRMIDIGKSSAGKKALRYTDEELGFGLPFETDAEAVLQTFIESEGLTLGETFFLGLDTSKGPFCVVAEIKL